MLLQRIYYEVMHVGIIELNSKIHSNNQYSVWGPYPTSGPIVSFSALEEGKAEEQ